MGWCGAKLKRDVLEQSGCGLDTRRLRISLDNRNILAIATRFERTKGYFLVFGIKKGNTERSHFLQSTTKVTTEVVVISRGDHT